MIDTGEDSLIMIDLQIPIPKMGSWITLVEWVSLIGIMVFKITEGQG